MATNITVITGSGTTTYTVNVDRRGPAGPNEVTTATTTNITGLLKGNGSTVLAATAGTDYAAAIHTHTSADITDATSDGQTNPGKLLKTDANGALQINTLSLGSSDIDATDPGELIIYNATDVESVYGSIKSSNLTTARDFELPNTSGTIMVGANNLSDLSSASTARTNLGLGSAADLRSILGIQVKAGTSTGLSSVGVTDITGLTGFTLEADTTYKLELHYLWTSASSNFQIEFVTTGSFYRGGTSPALGQAMTNVGAFSTSTFVNDTTFLLRGSVGENRTNIPFFGYAVFKTNTSGTGKLQLNLLSGSTLSTITSSVAMLTKMS